MKRLFICLYFISFNLILFLLIAPFVIFYGPFESLKLFTIGTILTSRHPQVAEFLLSQEEIAKLIQSYNESIITVEPVILGKEHIIIDRENGLKIENISGKYFRGKVMLINNPHQITLAVTKELGIAGQRLTDLVAESKAIAGINAGGFYDPNAQGNGAYPDGITVQEGLVIHNNIGNEAANIIGFDQNGKLVLSSMTVHEISKQKIQNAVTFYPNLLLEGKPQIKGDGGWGLAPRTGIGQRPDGTVILVVIDGRQPGWSMGATLRDLMNIFIEYGAENAANLDGGSSSEMVYKGQILNKLWNIYGERYIPTAFVILPQSSLAGNSY